MNFKQTQKKILKNKYAIATASFFITSALRLINLTMSNKTVGIENFEKANKGGEQPLFLCFWHGRLLMMPFSAPKGNKINILVSQHSDGQISSRIQKAFGLQIIFGSSSKGGSNAIRGILRAVKKKELFALTPDGPRGPARKVGGLTVEIAKKLDIPIIPVTFSCNKFKRLNSWDSLIIPKLFSKGIFMIGEAKKFESSKELEDAMNAITDEADRAAQNL